MVCFEVIDLFFEDLGPKFFAEELDNVERVFWPRLVLGVPLPELTTHLEPHAIQRVFHSQHHRGTTRRIISIIIIAAAAAARSIHM